MPGQPCSFLTQLCEHDMLHWEVSFPWSLVTLGVCHRFQQVAFGRQNQVHPTGMAPFCNQPSWHPHPSA